VLILVFCQRRACNKAHCDILSYFPQCKSRKMCCRRHVLRIALSVTHKGVQFAPVFMSLVCHEYEQLQLKVRALNMRTET